MSVATAAIPTLNTKPVFVADVPVVSLDDFREHLKEQLVEGSAALLALSGVPQGPQSLRLYGLTNTGATGAIHLLATDVGDRYPSLTQHITQAHWFKRELAEQWGVVPEGHPWLKPIRFHRSYQDGNAFELAAALDENSRKIFGRSLQLRQVSAGGCNAYEADINVLATLVFDLGRFGIKIVASPRRADGLVVTGPVTQNMKLALEKTYAATPAPKFVIAVGACAISGGPFVDHPEQHNGCDSVLPVDMYIPGCLPTP